ncbi:MAG: tRNA (N6-isopentenyl adenosine(37)-C2)-methylthiotransferase MiaB [Anaerobutyricum sp.]|nr:tRNA (N6-isopentenyl adenosine(37)-C2)-methylthiotransferase MiaB [Eubacterium sp.]MDY6046070.1 tRNA (N6-isopentenyl adenosine(37)-C2)-methylthiotransferase MiaB [Anaerobutyricum sp.]
MNINYDQIDINGPAPEQEPQRQQYFIAKCRNLLQIREKELGRKLTFFDQTFGCQMNFKDSEKLNGILEEIGYVPAESEDADFVYYNTCTVRENANVRVYGRLGTLKTYKKKNPDMVIAMCGCMMQEEEEAQKVRDVYKFVDIVFGTHNIFKLAELLFECLDSKRRVFDVWEKTDLIIEDLPSDRKFSFKAGVNIMFGCNNFCSYCIVPYVRGRERSRKPQDIVAEVEKLAKEGVVEIMLLGQNVNSYGKNLEEPVTFAELLRMVEQVDGIERIRFMTSHPKDLSDELIEVMASSKKICRHLHLPVQSGSSRLLKLMNRKYTKEQYLSLVDKLRAAMPDLAITTDIIVGFPGETEEDFQETLDIVRKAEYDSAFTFIYSKRSGTPAAKMEGQVPDDVVHERFDRLLKVVGEVAKEKNKRLEGRTELVLAEEIDEKDATMITGRLSNNNVVHFKADPSVIGKIVPVVLEEAKGFYYIGRLDTNG